MGTAYHSSDVVLGSDKSKSKETKAHIKTLRGTTLTQGQGPRNTTVCTRVNLLLRSFAIVPLVIVTICLHHAVVVDDRDPTTRRSLGSTAPLLLQESNATLQRKLSSLKNLVIIPVNRSQTDGSDDDASPNGSSPDSSARHRGPTLRYEQCRKTVQSLKTGIILPIHQRQVGEHSVRHDKVNAGGATGTNNTEDYHQYHICRYGSETIRIPQTPTLMILGAQKAGTTSLYYYLRQHPDITSSMRIEPRFLASQMRPMRRYAQAELGLVLPSKDDDVDNRQDSQNLTITNVNTDEEQFRCLTRDWYYNDVFGGVAERLPLTPKEQTTNIVVDTTNVTATEEEEYQYLPNRVTFEKSPNYIRSWEVPEFVQQILPWTHKFVVILRSPVDRAYSHYEMDVARRPGRTTETFDFYVRQEIEEIALRANAEEALSICDIDESCQKEEDRHRTKHYVRFGIYAPQVHHWLQYYPRSDFLFLNYGDLDRNTTDVYRRIVEFAGLSANHLLEMNEEGGRNSLEQLFRRYNAGNHNKQEERVRKNQKSNDRDSRSNNTNQSKKRPVGTPMSNETRAYLQEFFKPYHDQLLKEMDSEEWNSVEWT